MLKDPSSFDDVVCVRFVLGLWAFTATLATTPPLLSFTVPLIEPSVCCAGDDATSNKRLANTKTVERIPFNIGIHPFPRPNFTVRISHSHCAKPDVSCGNPRPASTEPPMVARRECTQEHATVAIARIL